MTLVITTEHVETALSRIFYQFKDQPRFEAFVTAFVAQFQDLENAVEQLLTDRQVDAATGENLNILGRIVGQPREDRDDTEFRIWIKARILINRSSGTTEEIYQLFNVITGIFDEGYFEVKDEYPSGFRFFSYFAVSVGGDLMLELIELVRGAGIETSLAYTITDPVFRFNSGPGFNAGHLAKLY